MPPSPVHLYAVTPEGPVRLPVPDSVRDLQDLYDGLPLGIYEGLRTFGGPNYLRLDAHFDRADRSLAAVGYDLRIDRDAMRRALHVAAREWTDGDARMRFDVLPEPARSLGTESRTLLALAPVGKLPADAFTHGLVLGIADHLHRRRPRVKEAQWIRDRRDAALSTTDVYEYALLDEQGRVLEGTTSNLFFVRDGVVLTAGPGVLEGVTRALVFELAERNGIEVRLEAVPLADVPGCDEAFLTSASRGPVPVTRLGDHVVGSGRPGPVARTIREAYDALVRAEARPAV